MPLPNRKGARRNRRAPGASSGGTFGRDKRSRLGQTSVSPVGGDRQIADCSAVNPRHCSLKETICVNLRDLRALRWTSDFAMASCLCVFVFAMSCSVFLSVSLCLCGSASGFQIHLRVHGIKSHRRFELGEWNLVVDCVRMKLIGRTKTNGRDAKKARNGASMG